MLGRVSAVLAAVAAGLPAVAAPVPLPQADDRAAVVPKGVTAVYGSLHYRLPADRLQATALSPDGKLIATVDPAAVRVYEAATWRSVRRFPVVPGSSLTYRPAFSPDGRHLAYLQDYTTVHVWDLATGEPVPAFANLPGRWERFVAFTPDGRLALADAEGLRFHDPATAKEVRGVPCGPGVVHLSADGKFYLRRPKDGEPPLVLGEVRTGKDLHTLAAEGRFDSGSAFSPDGRTVALRTPGKGELRLWDVAAAAWAGPPLPLPKAEYGADVGFTRDGKTVWAKAAGGVVRWDVATQKELSKLSAAGGPPFGELLDLPDGKTLLTPTWGGWVRVWDAATGTEVPVPGRYRSDSAFALSPDGQTVVVGDQSGRIDLLDAVTGKFTRTVRAKGDAVGRLVFGPGGRTLAVGEWWPRTDSRERAGRTRVLALAGGAEVRAFEPNLTDRFATVTPDGFAADGSLFLREGLGQIELSDPETGKELWRAKWTGTHAVSPDGRTLAAEHDGAVVLSDPATGKEVRRVRVEPAGGLMIGGYALAWAADGKTLAVGVPGNTVNPARPPAVAVVLDPATGKERVRFPADPRPPARPFDQFQTFSAFALSPDGRLLLAAADGGVGLWDAGTKALAAELPHEFQVVGAAFTPDGQSVLTFGRGGVGFRWDVRAVIAARSR